MPKRCPDSAIDVLALVTYEEYADGRDVASVARDYAVSQDAVEAALAFYTRHRNSIDARIAPNLSYAAWHGVAEFLQDHNAAYLLSTLLSNAGHEARTARDLRLARTPDYELFAFAAHNGCTSIRQNAEDFTLLHRAWRH